MDVLVRDCYYISGAHHGFMINTSGGADEDHPGIIKLDADKDEESSLVDWLNRNTLLAVPDTFSYGYRPRTYLGINGALTRIQHLAVPLTSPDFRNSSRVPVDYKRLLHCRISPAEKGMPEEFAEALIGKGYGLLDPASEILKSANFNWVL